MGGEGQGDVGGWKKVQVVEHGRGDKRTRVGARGKSKPIGKTREVEKKR